MAFQKSFNVKIFLKIIVLAGLFTFAGAAEIIDFETTIKPIIQEKCDLCHEYGTYSGAPPLYFADSMVFLSKKDSIIPKISRQPTDSGYMPQRDTLLAENITLIIAWLNLAAEKISIEAKKPNRLDPSKFILGIKKISGGVRIFLSPELQDIPKVVGIYDVSGGLLWQSKKFGYEVVWQPAIVNSGNYILMVRVNGTSQERVFSLVH